MDIHSRYVQYNTILGYTPQTTEREGGGLSDFTGSYTHTRARAHKMAFVFFWGGRGVLILCPFGKNGQYYYLLKILLHGDYLVTSVTPK